MGKGLSITVAVAFAVVAFALGVRVTVITAGGDTLGTPDWQMYFGLGMFGCAAALMILMIVRMLPLRKRASLRGWRSLSRAQRRYASRQLRGKLPVGPYELAFLRALALHRRDQRVMALQHAGIALLAAGEIVLSQGVLTLLIGLFMVVLGLAAVALVSYDVTNMTTFLDRHGWPGPEVPLRSE